MATKNLSERATAPASTLSVKAAAQLFETIASKASTMADLARLLGQTAIEPEGADDAQNLAAALADMATVVLAIADMGAGLTGGTRHDHLHGILLAPVPREAVSDALAAQAAALA